MRTSSTLRPATSINIPPRPRIEGNNVVKPSLKEDASPEEFGEAVMLCQGYTPDCVNAFDCYHEGMCFSDSGRGWRKARKMIQSLIDAERAELGSVHVRSWLKLALDALDHQQFMERGSLDAMRYVTISKAIRKKYNGQGLISDGRLKGKPCEPV
jgi:hypothetical protein